MCLILKEANKLVFGQRLLFHCPAQFFASAIDVDTEEPRAAVGAGVLVLVDHRPDYLAVGVGERK